MMQSPFETAWLLLKGDFEDTQKKNKRLHLIRIAPDWVYTNLLDYLEPDEIELFEELHGRVEELPDERRLPDTNKNATYMESIGKPMPELPGGIYTPPGTGEEAPTGREETPALIEPTEVGVLGAAVDPAEEEKIPPTNNNVKVQRDD